MSDALTLRAGDIFRIACAGKRYCYGIIMAQIKTLKEKVKLPVSHHLNDFPDSGFFYRLYRLVTGDPDLSPEDLAAYPLGPAVLSHGKIHPEGYTLIARRPITAGDLRFPILSHEICYVPAHSQAAFMDTLAPEDPFWDSLFGIFVEWGTAQTNLENKFIPTEIRNLVEKNCASGYYHTDGIDPGYADPSDFFQKGNLTLSRETETYQTLFPYFGLAPDVSFDDFAAKFGGLSLGEIARLLREE